MQYIAIASTAGNSLTAVDIEHAGHMTRWNMNTYTRFKISDPVVLFREVNEFWASQTEEVQERVWMIYWSIFQMLNDPMNVQTMAAVSHVKGDYSDLQTIYQRYIAALAELPDGYSEQDYANILQREYIGRYLKLLYTLFTEKDSDNIISNMTIVYATTMAETLAQQDSNYPDSGRTHTRADYNALASLAIRLRPMLPIFGQCMQVFQDRRKSSMKESSIITMLNDTDVFDMPAIPKLFSFMEASLKQFKATSTTIINGGIGTAELPSWLVAKALFRRVAPGEIDSGDGVSSIVTNIFNFIERSVFESTNRNFGPVHSKKRPDDNSRSAGRGDDSQSLLETISSREEITRGRRRMINVFARNTHLLARRIDPTISLDLVDKCCKLDPVRLAVDPHPAQDGLTRWVLSSAVPQHNVDYLRREGLFLYMGVAKAILEHWGYIEFAALMDSIPSAQDGIMPVAALWAHENFSQEVVAEMVNMFPYEMTGGRKTASIEEKNVGLRDAREMATLISIENWVVRNGRYFNKVPKDQDGFISFPPGFVNKIGQLHLRCSSGIW